MNARQAMDWLEDLDPEAEIAVTAKFPGLDGWRVTSWAVSTGEAEGCPVGLTISENFRLPNRKAPFTISETFT